jgi:hypothetical protein
MGRLYCTSPFRRRNIPEMRLYRRFDHSRRPFRLIDKVRNEDERLFIVREADMGKGIDLIEEFRGLLVSP